MPKRLVAILLAVCSAAAPLPAEATAPPVAGIAPPELVEALSQGLLTLPAPPELGTSAIRTHWHIPVILVSLSDSALTYGAPTFDHLLFDTSGSTPHGSVYDYYQWVSRGRMQVTGRVVATVSLPHDRYYYAYLSRGLNRTATPNNAAGMVSHAITAADDSVNWNEFDLDRDGYVDMLWVVHVGIGGEASTDPNNMWSITSGLSSYWNSSAAIESNDWFTGSTTLKVRLDRFTILPELSGFHPGQPSEIGVACHEFGHALGLPDLYDTADGGRIDAGPGNWSLMSSGAYGGDGLSPELPTHMGAWPMLFLGWIDRFRPSDDTTVVIRPIADGAPVMELNWQGGEHPDHYLVEMRHRQGFDQRLPGDGLIVYHVDDAAIGRGLQGNVVNAGLSPGLIVVEADGQHDLVTGRNRGDAGDLFPGPSQQTTLPEGPASVDTRTFEGTFTGLALRDVAASVGGMRVQAQVRAAGWLPAGVRETAAAAELGPATPHGLVRLGDETLVHVVSERRLGRAQLVVRDLTPLGETASEQVLETPGDARDPALVALPGSDLALVWRDTRDGYSRLYYRTRFRGTWSAEQLLTPGPVEVQFPVITCDPDGGVMTAWLDFAGAYPRLRFLRFPWLSPFGTPLTLTTATNIPGAPELAASPDGGAWILWRDGALQPPRIGFNRFHPDSGISVRRNLSVTVGGSQDWPAAAVDSAGTLHAAWVTDGFSYREIHYARRPRLGPAAPADTVIERVVGGVRCLQLELDRQGGVHMAYEHVSDRPSHTRYKRFHPQRGWDAYATEATRPEWGESVYPEIGATTPSHVTLTYLAIEAGIARAAVRTRVAETPGTVDVASGRASWEAPGGRLWPNPVRAGQTLFAAVASTAAPRALELIDLAGRVVAEAPYRGEPGSWEAVLPARDTTRLAAGIYFARTVPGVRARKVVLLH